MKFQLLINEISLMIATLFLILSASTGNTYLIFIGLAGIIYSANRVKVLKRA